MQYKSGLVNNMVSKCNQLLYHFSMTIHISLASFYATIYCTFEKNWLKEMLIEFELKELAVHILLLMVIFMTKQKSLRNVFEWIIISC